MEHDSLAAEIVAVVLREGDVKIALLAGGNADELALKAGNEGVGAENGFWFSAVPPSNGIPSSMPA